MFPTPSIRAFSSPCPSVRRVRIGICALDKKARSTPMVKITELLTAYGEFEIIVFGDHCILYTPVEEWPEVDCLIGFYSAGFPLAKAVQYCGLRKVFLVNEVSAQRVLLDRRAVYAILAENGIQTPPGLVFVNREKDQPEVKIVEFANYIEVNGVKLEKPFVEKPASGEDHNVYIYYPNWGGTRRLFRKVENASSELFPNENSVRREGSFIYESFMNGAVEIKAYTVGPNYVYAETRKSPTIDGIVERDVNGKELREVVRLNQEEIVMAQRVITAFRQNVCGFDILRHNRVSYVIDVNGWSFVKGSMQYYDACASHLRSMFLNSQVARARFALSSDQVEELKSNELTATTIVNPLNNSMLRAVVAVFRHGDRTPKQKVKLQTSDRAIIDYYVSFFAKTNPRATTLGALKVTSKDASKELANVVNKILAQEPKDPAIKLKLKELSFVLERENLGKIQIKPTFLKTKAGKSDVQDPHWDIFLYSFSSETKPQFSNLKQLSHVELICKWGGVLTHAGIRQARDYGHTFRDQLFLTHDPEKRKAFLSGLQAFASDEDRVKQTTKVFFNLPSIKYRFFARACSKQLNCLQIPPTKR